MLQSMRELAHSWVVKSLMLLLIVSFGIWGIGDMFRGNPLQQTVAKAGAEKITVQELNHAFEQSLSHARQMFGPDITPQQARQMGLADNTLNGLIETSLFRQDLKRLGIEADDRTAFAEISQDPQFKDKDGKFDKALFQSTLAGARIGEREFLDQQKKDLASRQLISAFTSLPTAPQSVIDALYKARGQKRILDVVTLDNSAVKSASEPDDKTLLDFYQQHPQAFTVPELRGVTIAVMSTDAIAKDITISDDQVKKEYDSKGDQLAEPEKRDLLQVILQDEHQAKNLAEAAKASGNLVSAAKTTGHEVVPLNKATLANMPDELAQPAFALSEHGITDPIKTALGWHILQLRKITPAGLPHYEDMKESLRDTMKRDQAADAAAKYANQLDDELAAGHAIEDIADGMKLRLIKIPVLDASGKTPDGKPPAELPYKEDLLKAAFAQNSGETSPVMDDHAGSSYVIRTDKVTPSALKPFEEARPTILAAWEKQEQARLAEEEANAIAKDLRDGKAASSFAKRRGVEVRVSRPISLLGDSDPAFAKSELPQILKLGQGEVTILPEPGKQVIVRLAEIVPVDNKTNEDAAHKIIGELNGAAPRELAEQYMKYLRVLFPVTIHQDAFDSIAPQGG
jgi:peptidyl-prolyl cis-trans isomerase D